MPNMVLRSFQAYGANDEILNGAVDEIKSAVKSAKASGTVQVVSLMRKGYRDDLQVGEIYVVPPAVCDSMEDFPRALLLSKIRQHATPEGQIEFEMGALVDKADMSKETLSAFKDIVFRDGGEGDLKPLLVFRACWSSPYDAIGFLYDEKTLLCKLREVAYAAPFNPALSSVLDALKSVSENHAAFVVSAPVTQHMFSIPDGEEQEYPEFVPGLDYAPAEEDGRTKKTKTASVPDPRRGVIRITAANIPAIEKEVLSDDEMNLFASMDKEVGNTVVSSEESGLRESPLSGLITAAAQPATYQDTDFGKDDKGLQHRPDYGAPGSKETITPAMVDGPDFRTASIPGTVTPISTFGKGEGVASTLSQAVDGVGTAPGAVLPSKFAGMVMASPADPLTGTDNPQTDAERTASAVKAGVGEAHQVDNWDKVYGKTEAHTTPGTTTTQTGTVMDVRHPEQHIDNDQSNGSDVPNSDGGGESMGDMGGGTVTASAAPGPWVVIDTKTGEVEKECANKGEATKVYNRLNADYLAEKPGARHFEMKAKSYHEEMKPKQAGISSETVRAVRRFTENFGGHYLPLKALQEELSRLTTNVEAAMTFLNTEGLLKPYGNGVKVLNKDLQVEPHPRQASYVIRNASGQVWACADVAGVKMGGYWATDAEQESHDFKNEAEAHEEVRRNCLDREGAIVMPKGIGPLKLASWWSPGRAIATLYPELGTAPSTHVPGRRASGKHKPKRAQSWFDQGTVADAMNIPQVDNNAPNFEGELGQQESPDLINPFGAPGNGEAQAPVSLSGCPEGMNQEYSGVPLKQDNNFYGPEFMREFYAPDLDMDNITVKHQASLKAKKAETNPKEGEGETMLKAFRFDNPRPYQGQVANRAAAMDEVGKLKANPEIKQIEVFILWGGQWSLTNRWERSAPEAEWDEQAQHEMYRTSSLRTAAPGDPRAPQPGATPPPPMKAPSFLDALNLAAPEDEPKVPYIDPQQDGDGIDNPSPAYLMMDKLVKGCMGAYVAQLIGAFQFTQKPLELETPFEDKINLQEVMAFGGASSPTAQNAAQQQLTHALELLSDDERKQLVNDGFAQGAVWCESSTGAGGYTYEVFARVEALEGPTVTVKVVTGIR